MRKYHHWTDAQATLTLPLSIRAAARGKTFRVAIPLRDLFLDHRPTQKALVSFVLGAAFGGVSGAPAGVRVTVENETKLSLFQAGQFEPRTAVALDAVRLRVEVAADATLVENVPLVLLLHGVATEVESSQVLANVTGAAVQAVDAALGVFDINGGGVAAKVEEASGGIVTITSSAVVQDLPARSSLAAGDESYRREITIPHASTRVFTTPLSLRLSAVPVGVRVTPLLAQSNGDKTDGGQFVLLVENLSYATAGYGQGTALPDVALNWERKGF